MSKWKPCIVSLCLTSCNQSFKFNMAPKKALLFPYFSILFPFLVTGNDATVIPSPYPGFHLQFGLLPRSPFPLYLDLGLCFWIKFTSYGLLYLSLNKIYSGFHHLNCSKSLSSDTDKCSITLTKMSLKSSILLNYHTGRITHLFLSLLLSLYSSKINLVGFGFFF